MSRKQRLLESGVKFHGHLGPYLVLGLCMGMAAIRILKPKGLHELSVRVWTKKTPPESCLLDGIQVSSGCTLGKGNVRVDASRQTRAVFRKGKRTLVLQPAEKIVALLSHVSKQTPGGVQQIALTIYRMSDRELFATP